ncbi:MAG: hypothetical protein ACK58L_14880 [Planctomycetota bacterium]
MAHRVVLTPGWLRLVWLLIFGMIPGCQWGRQPDVRSPAVTTRFTAGPMLEDSEGNLIAMPKPQPMTVGLAMQSSPEPAHMSFAAQLGTVLIRELQLSPGSVRVTPLAAVELRSAVPALETHDSPDVITVSLQEPAIALPPKLPPSPYLDSGTPPLVEQILVVRVIEYRAYYPMLATLDLRVLNGNDQTEMFSTTVSWSGDEYRLGEPSCPPKKRWWFCKDPGCDPGPSHNSPQALMHEIGKDVTSWYCTSGGDMSGQCLVMADSDPDSAKAQYDQTKPAIEESRPLQVEESPVPTQADQSHGKTVAWRMPSVASFRKDRTIERVHAD